MGWSFCTIQIVISSQTDLTGAGTWWTEQSRRVQRSNTQQLTTLRRLPNLLNASMQQTMLLHSEVSLVNLGSNSKNQVWYTRTTNQPKWSLTTNVGIQIKAHADQMREAVWTHRRSRCDAQVEEHGADDCRFGNEVPWQRTVWISQRFDERVRASQSISARVCCSKERD